MMNLHVLDVHIRPGEACLDLLALANRTDHPSRRATSFPSPIAIRQVLDVRLAPLVRDQSLSTVEHIQSR